MNATQLPRRSGLPAVLLFLLGLILPAAAQTLPAHYRQTNNIPYVTGGQHRQWLDVYHVPGATTPTPLVVWVHGGGWLTGDENFPRALALTNHNVAVAAISYRFTTNQFAPSYPANVPHPAQIQDVKSAIRWLRANAAQFNIDPARIGIWGYSSGGHLAALAGTTGHTNLFDVGENLGQSSAVQAVADMSGPANIGLATANQQTANFFTLLLGAPVASNPATLATVNPTSHARAGAPPFLLIHGETDPEVVIAHSESLHNALTNTGLSSLFVRLPGIGHTIPASQDPLTAQWLADTLAAVGATNPPPADTLRAHEPFAAAAGTFLHGQSGGTGFASAWTVLGFDSNANQFRNASAAPLASGTLLATGNYVVGGYNNFTANRRLDVAGAFANHVVVGSNPAVIGRDGTTLWLAALVRKDSNDDVQFALTLANGDDMGNVNNLRVGMGYYGTPSNSGGQRFWSLLINNPGVDNFTFMPGNVPITIGVATLLVVRIQFGVTDQIDLFVNPPLGGAAPVTPNATRSTTGGANILFRTVAFWSSANQSNAAMDELRLGDTFAAVTPTPAPVATPGTLQFSAASYSVAENAGTASITVTRTGGSSGAVGVSYATSNGSATAGSDYTASSGTLGWANGDAANKSFAITLLDDTAVETAETVNLSLSNPTGGATLGSPASAVLTVTSDDAPPFNDDLAVLSDEFNAAATLATYQRVNSVEGWNADKLEARDINTSRAGRMTMLPRTGGWYNDYIGELTFRPVSGDFVVTTEVIPRNRAGTAAPSGDYSLAGLMIRTPTAHTTGATGWPLGQQNYVFLSMGAANNPGTYQFEVKNTVNSSSTLTISSAPSTQTELQIARLGGAVITLRRDAGGQWLVHRRFARGDFPDTLQAGLVAYTDYQGMQARFPIAQPGSYLGHNSTVITDQNPGLRAEFEYLRYHRPQIPAELAGRDFSNPAQVTDAELLSFLGANANAPYAPTNTPPTITMQPASQTLTAGANVTFSVTATGTAPLAYQWQSNSVNLAGATASNLVLNAVTTNFSGASYRVVITNSAGSVTSSVVTLTVNPPPAPGPLITAHPRSQTVNAGSLVLFTVVAQGAGPLTYQWRRDSVNLPGATNAFFVLLNPQPADAGAYTAVVTDAPGSVLSGAGALTVQPLVLPAPPAAGTGVAADITIGTHVVAPAPVRFGANLVQRVPINNYIRGGGMEPTVARMQAVATGGGAGFVENSAGATTSYYNTITDGFFDGAALRVYRLVAGVNTLVQTNVIAQYLASTNNGYRINLATTGPAIQAGDTYFIDMVTTEPRTDRVHPRIRPGAIWHPVGGAVWPFGLPVQVAYDDTTQAPVDGGVSSLRLSTTGSHEVSVRQPRFGPGGSFYDTLLPGHTYRASAWLRHDGTVNGGVTLRLDQFYGAVSNRFANVTTNWQRFTFDFVAPAEPAVDSISEVILAFNGPGTVWIDNVQLFDPALAPDAPLPHLRRAMEEFRPGVLRLWAGQVNAGWGTTLETLTQSDLLAQGQWAADTGPRAPENLLNLPHALPLCRDVNARPWLIIGAAFNEAEWRGLVEYLAGPTNTFYGARRAAQGHPQPWTDDFDQLYLERGNETWNPSFAPWSNDALTYGAQTEYFIQVAKSSPYWPAISNKVRFVHNGWFTNPGTNGYGATGARASRSAHFLDLTTYLGGWELGLAAGGTNITTAGFQTYVDFVPGFLKTMLDRHLDTRAALHAEGIPVELAIYEGGPGYSLPGPGITPPPAAEAFGKSLAAGTANLDAFLYCSANRIDPQSFFHFGEGTYWNSHAVLERGFHPHPTWVGMELRNRFASGAMVATHLNRAPTRTLAGVLGLPATEHAPQVAAYAFRDGAKFSLFVLSRSVTEATPVTLRLPFTSVTSVTRHKLEGDPQTNNLARRNVAIVSEPVAGFSANFTFTLPPSASHLYVFEGANVAPPAAPTPTIARALGQPNPTDVPAAGFLIHFDMPVTNFTAAAVQVGGTAGAQFAAVTPLAPGDGTRFQIIVTGATNNGTITLNLPAGAVLGTNGAPSLAAQIVDNSVTFMFRQPQNVRLAHDDFSVPLTNTFHTLQGAASGSGWLTPWQVQNVNVATDTAGYRLATNNPPARSNLVATAGHAVGGRGFEMSWRDLDVGAFGSFAKFGAPTPTIGQDGLSLWMSVLLRKDTDDNAPVSLMLADATGLTSFGRFNAAVGFFGTSSITNGTRRWTLAFGDLGTNALVYLPTAVPVVPGETALLVLELRFGSQDTLNLYVNPPLTGAIPGTPSAVAVLPANLDLAFRSVRFLAGLGGGHFTGNGLNVGSLDELRFGDSFAAVTPLVSGPANVAPTITQEPMGAVVVAGTNFTLTVSATGTPSLSYQWLRNNVALPGATAPALSLPNVTRAQAGSYFVVVTNTAGTSTSTVATLRVLNMQRLLPPQPVANGGFRLLFNDHDGGALTLGDAPNFEVWVSTNLVGMNWTRLNLPLTVTNGLLTLDDADAPNHPRRFYRVLER